MRKLIIMLLFLANAFALSYFQPNCAAHPDSYGFIELSAGAVWYDNVSNAYCTNTTVTATVANHTYSLNPQYDCNFTKLIQLQVGTYDISYKSVFPNETQNQTCYNVSVLSVKTLDIVYYGVQNGDVLLQNSTLHVQAVAVVGQENVPANMLARIIDKGGNITKEVKLGLDAVGTQIGDLVLNLSTGDYTLRLNALYNNLNATTDVAITVASQIGNVSQGVNFTARIITPVSSVYLRDSTINAVVKVLKWGEPVNDASVVLKFQNQDIAMTYDRFGEYTAVIGPLASEGDYDLKAVATKDQFVAQDEVTFAVSKHTLDIDSISPFYNQELSLKKGDSLEIKAILLDEERDVVSGALVIAKILESDGKALQMQLFQDSTTGAYKGVLYLNELNGVYQLKIDASKANFVPITKDSQFNVQFEKEKVQIFSQVVTVENLLYIVLGVAVLILLAALLRAVF
jgi:hypothetical protein